MCYKIFFFPKWCKLSIFFLLLAFFTAIFCIGYLLIEDDLQYLSFMFIKLFMCLHRLNWILSHTFFTIVALKTYNNYAVPMWNMKWTKSFKRKQSNYFPNNLRIMFKQDSYYHALIVVLPCYRNEVEQTMTIIWS